MPTKMQGSGRTPDELQRIARAASGNLQGKRTIYTNFGPPPVKRGGPPISSQKKQKQNINPTVLVPPSSTSPKVGHGYVPPKSDPTVDDVDKLKDKPTSPDKQKWEDELNKKDDKEEEKDPGEGPGGSGEHAGDSFAPLEDPGEGPGGSGETEDNFITEAAKGGTGSGSAALEDPHAGDADIFPTGHGAYYPPFPDELRDKEQEEESGEDLEPPWKDYEVKDYSGQRQETEEGIDDRLMAGSQDYDISDNYYNSSNTPYWERGKAQMTYGNNIMSEDSEFKFDFDDWARANDVRYGLSYSSFDHLSRYFDISRLPDYQNTPMPFMGYLLFTRPSLNYRPSGYKGKQPDMRDGGSMVGGNTGDAWAMINWTRMMNSGMCGAFLRERSGQIMAMTLSSYNTSPWLTMFSNRAASYNVGDVALKTVEKQQTFFGHSIRYGKHSEEHRAGGSITIDFRNDYQLSILKAVYIWMSYIRMVSKTEQIAPSPVCQKRGILDYAGSIYYLVTDMTGSRLVYWEKLTGVFPKTAPFSVFSSNDSAFIVDKISVEFEYGVRSDPCDLDVLMDINTLSSASGETGARAAFNNNMIGKVTSVQMNNGRGEGRFARGNSLACYPIIYEERSSSRGVTYWLQWSATSAYPTENYQMAQRDKSGTGGTSAGKVGPTNTEATQ